MYYRASYVSDWTRSKCSSRRANECYDDDILPMSHWTKYKILDVAREHIEDTVREQLVIKLESLRMPHKRYYLLSCIVDRIVDRIVEQKVTLAQLKTCLDYHSWHHTGKYARVTEFYEINIRKVEELLKTEEITKQILKMEESE